MATQEIKKLLGELIMPRLEIDAFLNELAYAERISSLVRNKQAGGFCAFGGTAADVARVVKTLQNLALESHNKTLIFSCDCEFGLPMRLADGGTEFPDAMAIAKTGEPELAYKTGQAIAREMKALGLSWNLAPVTDVNSNPKNPIINTRAFGENPEVVSEYATAYMLGLQSEGVAATAKHFPGHGDTSVDSHRELPMIEREWEPFQSLELPPFETLINRGVFSVMTGHLSTPKLAAHFGAPEDEQNLPATLSHAITTTLLREQLGFAGVVVTDALEMRAITKHFGGGEAVVLAFQAGADVLLMPADPVSAFESLLFALDEGRITSDEIVRSVLRIRAMKEKVHANLSAIDSERLQEYTADHTFLSKEIARKAIDVSGSIHLANARMIILADERGDAVQKAKIFETAIRPSILECEIMTPQEWTAKQVEIGKDTILVTFHRARGYVNPVDSEVTIPSIVRAIGSSLGWRQFPLCGLVLFGNPYLNMELQTPPLFVMKTFSESRASIEAAVEILQTLK